MKLRLVFASVVAALAALPAIAVPISYTVDTPLSTPVIDGSLTSGGSAQ